MSRHMLDIKKVMEKLCTSRTSIYEMLNPRSKYYDQEMPAPIRLGKRQSRWFEDELDAYLESRPRTRNGAALQEEMSNA